MGKYDNRISIWRNKDKKEDKHPDFTGTINIDGVLYECGLWKRAEDASPEAPALSGPLKHKKRENGKGSGKKAPEPEAELDDDIPF